MPVPSLSGKTVRQVMEICQQLGLNPVLVGSGIATEQEPARRLERAPRRNGNGLLWPRRRSGRRAATRSEGEQVTWAEDAVCTVRARPVRPVQAKN